MNWRFYGQSDTNSSRKTAVCADYHYNSVSACQRSCFNRKPSTYAEQKIWIVVLFHIPEKCVVVPMPSYSSTMFNNVWSLLADNIFLLGCVTSSRGYLLHFYWQFIYFSHAFFSSSLFIQGYLRMKICAWQCM